MTERLAIIDGVRTPFCGVGLDLATFSAADLGRTAVDALLTRSGIDPADLDEVFFGCVHQPANGENVAQTISRRAGVPSSVAAVTVHRGAVSSAEAVLLAQARAASGAGSLFLAGGVDSLSGQQLKNPAGPAAAEPLREPTYRMQSPGLIADGMARRFGFSREAQDDFSAQSRQRLGAARSLLDSEICPVYITDGAGKAVLRDRLEREIRRDELAKLSPAFERYGTVTAGNSALPADGAVALLVGTEARARELGLQPLGFISAFAHGGEHSLGPGLEVVSAIQNLARTGISPVDADIVELEENFAAQVLSSLKVLREERYDVPEGRLNVNGGALALGHVPGASGARLILAALKSLQRSNGRHALVTLDSGDGQGVALWLSRS